MTRILERIGKDDTLVVVRIDRLARSLSHLLEVIERLEAKGAFFRSLLDPIETASPQGKFTLQALGAAAEFERSLIRERTKAGLASARAAVLGRGWVIACPVTQFRTQNRTSAVIISRQASNCTSLRAVESPWGRDYSLCVMSGDAKQRSFVGHLLIFPL